jgi:Clp amino terminal domain, pathogenicity island component
MFERYTEKARRVVFFARYEASAFASETIGTEHLLLGFLREDKELARKLFPGQSLDGFTQKIRKELDEGRPSKGRVSTSMEMPLTNDSKKVLTLAMESAQRLGHSLVGPAHLLIGMLGVENCRAARFLAAQGIAGKSETDLAALAPNPEPGPKGAPYAGDPMRPLENFLEGIRSMDSGSLMQFFSCKTRFVDATGRLWNYEEIEPNLETLLAPYAKKNATYIIETTVAGSDAFIAIVLWKNALLASLQRSWMHRMTIALTRDGLSTWEIALVQATAVLPPG